MGRPLSAGQWSIAEIYRDTVLCQRLQRRCRDSHRPGFHQQRGKILHGSVTSRSCRMTSWPRRTRYMGLVGEIDCAKFQTVPSLCGQKVCCFSGFHFMVVTQRVHFVFINGQQRFNAQSGFLDSRLWVATVIAPVDISAPA